MSFLKKNLNYSKIKVLLNSIEKTGEFSIGKDTNTGISYDYLIPNNKKYYLLITKKQLLKQQKYDILHFFPDHDDLLETNRSFDFYLKIDSFFDDEVLLEGYLYKSDDKYEYLLTDILVRNNEIVNVSFELRYSLLNEIIQKIGREKLMYLNNHMTIKIHPVVGTFSCENSKITRHTYINETDIKKSDIYENDINETDIDDSDMTISSLLASTID